EDAETTQLAEGGVLALGAGGLLPQFGEAVAEEEELVDDEQGRAQLVDGDLAVLDGLGPAHHLVVDPPGHPDHVAELGGHVGDAGVAAQAVELDALGVQADDLDAGGGGGHGEAADERRLSAAGGADYEAVRGGAAEVPG